MNEVKIEKINRERLFGLATQYELRCQKIKLKLKKSDIYTRTKISKIIDSVLQAIDEVKGHLHYMQEQPAYDQKEKLLRISQKIERVIYKAEQEVN
ncbi:MAG: hypothetical protein H7A33_07905 [Deltaproteobacteria bacterium]|nr:hypothetical protein [Deltaproteobacteria bacterium]